MNEIHLYSSSVISVGIGAVLASLYTFYLSFLSNRSNLIRDYVVDLNQIEILIRSYWLFDIYDQRSEVEHEAIGHELRAKLQATATYGNVTRDLLKSDFGIFDALDTKLFDTATGGCFQAGEFKPSPEVYSESVELIQEMRVILRRKQSTMFWAS
jgi:hypothetical protein